MKVTQIPPAIGPEADPAHDTPIRTPKQLIAWILAGFLVPIITIALIVTFVSSGTTREGAGSSALTPRSIEQRIAPVAQLEMRDPNAPKVLQSGEQVYKAVCAGCHAAGVAGAPKFADTTSWAARLKQGYETLVTHAVQGIRAMPAKGGNPDLDDQEVAAAVRYMANASGAKFAEPPATQPATAPAAAAAPATPAVANVGAETGAAGAAGTTAATAAPPPVAGAPGTSTAPVPTNPRPGANSAMPGANAVESASNDTTAIGKKLYDSACVACHAAGVAGAPKFGDKAAWAPRLALGIDALTQSVIHGKSIMPPRGGVTNATDAELRAAVTYLTAAAR